MTLREGDRIRIEFEAEVYCDPQEGSEMVPVLFEGRNYGAPRSGVTVIEPAWDPGLPVGTVRTLTRGRNVGKAIIKNRETHDRGYVWTVLGGQLGGGPTSYMDSAEYVRSSVSFGKIAEADPRTLTDGSGDTWYETSPGFYTYASTLSEARSKLEGGNSLLSDKTMAWVRAEYGLRD